MDDDAPPVMSAAEASLDQEYRAAVAGLAGGDPAAALAAVNRVETALTSIEHPDAFDVLNVRLLRIRGLRLAGRNDEAAAAAKVLSSLLGDLDNSMDGCRLRVQVELEWGDALRAAGHYLESGEHSTSALATALHDLGGDDADTGSAWNSVGVWHRYYGDHHAAGVAYDHALRIAEGVGGPDCLNVASIVHNLASLHQTRGDAPSAEAPARRALAIRKAVLGPEHPDVAADLGVLGVVLADLGRLEEAADCYRQARRIFADPVRPHQAELAFLSCNEAALEHLRGRWVAAETAYRTAQMICVAELGSRHPQVAVVLLNRATLALDRGDPDAARAHATACETILAGQVSEDHPNLVYANEISGGASILRSQ